MFIVAKKSYGKVLSFSSLVGPWPLQVCLTAYGKKEKKEKRKRRKESQAPRGRKRLTIMSHNITRVGDTTIQMEKWKRLSLSV